MVKLPKIFRFGKKSAKRYSVDFSQGKNPIGTDAETVNLRDYLETDADLAANVRRFVDNILIESPKIVPADGEDVVDSTLKGYNRQLTDVRFYKIMRAALYHLIWNGNAFLEIKFNGRKLKEAYNIDPDTIDIIKNVDDEVIGYEQRVNGSPVAQFTPEEIVHISIDHLDSGVWGHALMKPLKSALFRKALAEDYLQWLIQNNKFSPMISVEGDLIEEKWNHIVSQFNVNALDPNFHQIVNIMPDEKIELIRIFTTDDFERIFQYIEKQNEQIITLLQVPPIISGTVDNSNRSNSEIQARLVFYNTITAFQNLIIEELNFEMLRKLKWNNVQFKFPSIDQRVDIETIKLATTLRKDLGFTQEAIKEFLKENGFKIPKVKTLFDPVMVQNFSNEGGNSDKAPSRQPRDKSGLVENEAKRLEDRKMGVSNNKN